MKYLNIGCGGRYHPDWTNIDLNPPCKEVRDHNIINGLPFPDNSFDAVYHSHVLEHIPKDKTAHFLQECRRVLKPEGIIRIVVPDLEQMVKLYLEILNKQDATKKDLYNYEWLMLEIFDQTVRNKNGGEMLNFFTKENIINHDFIVSRIGKTANDLKKNGQELLKLHAEEKLQKPGILRKIFRLVKNINKDTLLKLLLGKDYAALQIGRFRQSGEIHYWMYDRFSLKNILQDLDFKEIKLQDAFHSYLKSWNEFKLDIEADGTEYKPESLYIEAKK